MDISVKPYKDSDCSKKVQVERMFDNISNEYDFLNHFLSFGIDVLWRKRLVRRAGKGPCRQILDVATGTGDLALMLLKTSPDRIVGADISRGMLDVARRKASDRGVSDRIVFQQADSEALPFDKESFDLVTVAFGVRNFENLDKGLSEFFRVLRPGGRVLVLEFSQPEVFPVRQLYGFYSRKILPRLSSRFTRDKKAYDYLPESIAAFPYGKEFLKRLEGAGFFGVSATALTFGIASLYQGEKR